jgi:ABC-type bacteriocin/lantibiotic exporter with double-glycine peptidase domain
LDYFYNEFITNSQPVNLIESSINKIDFIKINLVDVTYFYYDKNQLIFENTSLEINAGNKVAIIGDSGIGKSTLLDLLSGLINPKEGIILINNEILTHSNRKSWLNSIAYVPQTIFLRNASIYENIGIVDEKIDIDYKKIYECAKIVDLHNFFINLSDGYNTILGENGIEISGGQRQRIGIARALYSRKKIIILDEATNSIDKNLQEKILENLLNMNNKITLIFNTHQTEIINKFDRIFTIKNKKIIEV